MPYSADLYYQIHQPESAKNKPPLVLIHGAGGNHLYWPANIRRLPDLHVLAIDLPGHGNSGGRVQETVKDYAKAVKNWLDSLQIRCAILVGHSLGAAITLDLAVNDPERILGIGLLGSSAKLVVNPYLIENARNEQTIQNAVAKLIQWSFGQDTPTRIRTLAAQRLAKVRPEVLHSDLLACQDFDLTAQIDQIRMPCLVVCGEKDKMTPPHNSQYLAEHIPGATFTLIPNAGHMVMLEQPEQVAQILIRFANQLILAE